MSTVTAQKTTPQCCALPEMGCIEVRGTDAAAFLNGQLSQAVADLGADRAPLAGWHDARGRVRALLRVVRISDVWLLLTGRSALAATLQRLRMFVLRSAVIFEAAADWQAAAVLGADEEWLAGRGLPSTAPRDALVQRGDLRWLHVGMGYWQALGPGAVVEHLEPRLERVPPQAAARAEIALGIPTITAPLVDKFVAQMLNLDALGALSFDKGCYPGQEVIARVHNLGSVKRRVRRYAADSVAELPVTAEVRTAEGVGVGEVIRSAPADGGCELLAVVEHSAAHAPLTSGGAPLRLLSLPFEVPDR